MELFTNRYRDFKPDQGTPVRITYGAPKYKLPFDLRYQSKMVTPGSWFMSGTDAEFTRRYFAMLDRHGVDRVRSELEAISELAGSDRLVLLCFDDVRKGLCHRTLFAQWWEKQTGEKVRELQEGCDGMRDTLF